MNIFKDKKKPSEVQSKISAQEAHRIWSKAQSRYVLINNIQLLSNFTHDLDFKYVLGKLKKSYEKQANILEKELNKYSIKSPEPNKTNIKASGNSEVLTDKEIARTIYSLTQLAVGKCMKTINSTIFNDDLREILIKITKEEINKFFDFVKYIKTKGWIENPPLYPDVKANDIVAANEIWELWQHLHYRYTNIQETKIFNSFVNDLEFSSILDKGITILEEQTIKLENLLLNYGINLPNKHPKNIPTPESKELFDDKFIFIMIIGKMQNATTIHGFALQEMVINEKLIEFFKSLLFDEMYYIDKLVRYGKIKGWIPLVPVYRVQGG